MTQNASDQAGIVVIGAGLAAAHTLSTLRDGGYTGQLTLIGNEGELPYERPPLSKDVLAGNKDASSAYVHDADWYAEHHIDLRLDDAATRIDHDRQHVVLASGTEIPYADLVIATGATPRVPAMPGTDLAGVHTLRTMADSLALRESFGTSRHLVVIGAGWIGLEAAAAARQAGLEVTVLEYTDVPLLAAMGPSLGGYFAELHRRNGVDLRTGAQVEGLKGADGKVTGVRVDGSVVDADLVLVGIGAAPNTQLAEAAGLDVDHGIMVDDQLRSSDPHILAIGDAANARHAGAGAPLRVEHWDNAIRQGKLAGRVLLGGDDRYDWQPYFYTDQFDLGMEYVGHGSADDDVVIRGDQSTGEFIAFWLSDGIVTAAMNVNIWDVSDDLRATIGQRIDPGRLADPAISLTDLT